MPIKRVELLHYFWIRKIWLPYADKGCAVIDYYLCLDHEESLASFYFRRFAFGNYRDFEGILYYAFSG